jgi:hypothetical protein
MAFARLLRLRHFDQREVVPGHECLTDRAAGPCLFIQLFHNRDGSSFSRFDLIFGSIQFPFPREVTSNTPRSLAGVLRMVSLRIAWSALTVSALQASQIWHW